MPIKQIKFKPAQFSIINIKQQRNKENILIIKIHNNKRSNKSE